MAGKKPSLYIFEGGEGSGKTTTAQQLTDYLRAKGRQVKSFHAPGGTEIAEMIRKILLYNNERPSPKAEIFLFLASIADLVERQIAPALMQGQDVVLDRFLDSTRCYQILSESRSGDWEELYRTAVLFIERELDSTSCEVQRILLDISAEESLCRLRSRTGKASFYDVRPLAYHQQINASFLEHFKEKGERKGYFIVDASGRKDEVFMKVLQVINI